METSLYKGRLCPLTTHPLHWRGLQALGSLFPTIWEYKRKKKANVVGNTKAITNGN